MINFFTLAIGKYKRFIAPYVTSVLINNKDAVCEIITDAPRTKELDAVCDIFGDRCMIWTDTKSIVTSQNQLVDINRAPNAFRFLTVPSRLEEMTYIGDVDVLVLDNDVSIQHNEHMKEIGLPYSNIVRDYNAKRPRLTGLHCVKTTDYYYHKDDNGNNIIQNLIQTYIDFGLYSRYGDEELLYMLCKEGIGIPHKTTFRPVHGIHISPNRQPFEHKGVPGWGISAERMSQYRKMKEKPEWKEAYKYFDEDYKKMLILVEESAKERGL